MPLRRARAVACASSLLVAAAAAEAVAQSKAPSLSRPQRAALAAVVDAVDRAAAGGDTLEATWQTHVLRASDGAHYVALRFTSRAAGVPTTPVALYVRLSTRRVGAQTLLAAERSAVREWLRGERSDPRPRSVGGSMSVPRGEMPVGGTAMAVGDVAAESTAALRLLMMEHQNAVKRREADEAARRAALENPALARASGMLPFEDFDVAARPGVTADGAIDVRRSLAAGPGDYDLHIGWTAWTGRGAPQPVYVVTHRLRLPAAPPVFGLSDVIVADRVDPIAAPYPPDLQNAHPYAAGALELSPAPGGVLTADGTLGLLVQVINPSAPPGGKPDVTVTFRVQRRAGEREETVGTLTPLRFDAARLPGDFDVARGHPLLAATQASLASFGRGRYRVLALAQDHLSGATATADADFEVVGTPASLLREAPRPGRPYRREALLVPDMRALLARTLAPSDASAPLAAGLASLARGEDAALLRADAVAPGELGVQQALRAFGLYALGDTARTVTAQLQAAAALGVPEAPLALLLGAAQALGGDDRGAIESWERARGAGLDAAVTVPLLVDGYTRRGDIARATTLARMLRDLRPDDPAAARGMAALHVATGHPDEALQVLDAAPLAGATDADTAFLRVHALFASIVTAGTGATAAAAPRTAAAERFAREARSYVQTGAPHAALVEAWQQALATARSR